VPSAVSDEAASFTPLCAIALQGINLLAPVAGDRVVVTGLGLIGQLAVRILLARGCEVMGLDPSPERRALAEKSGAVTAQGDPVAAALGWSIGRGVAGVLITASTSSNEVVNQAARSCRPRGKVVLVGVVGLQLNRADFYRNEISFQVSCSYGARDARAASSAQSNFNQVLAWMAEGKLPVEDLISHKHEFNAAAAAYAQLADRSALGIVLTYDARKDDVLSRTTLIGGRRDEAKKVVGPRVALIGAGNFASRTLLPILSRLSSPPNIAVVASAQGASARLAAQSCGAERATTDVAAVLADPSIEAVFITTRHNVHSVQVVEALSAGKNVWIEKPLCLTLPELSSIEEVIGLLPIAGGGRRPVLMVGFNRRFSPMAVALRQALTARSGAHRILITVNAGQLPPDHWTLDPQTGGGRIVGEVCHFVDLARYFAGAPIKDVRCLRRDTDGQDGGAFEVLFPGGTSAVIDYRTDLAPLVSKELIEISGNGFSAEIHNWSRLTSRGLGGLSQGSFWSRASRKGHPEAIKAFLNAVHGEREPITLAEVFEVSRWCIAMQAMRAGSPSGL
jgi:predicted dehydrogenase